MRGVLTEGRRDDREDVVVQAVRDRLQAGPVRLPSPSNGSASVTVSVRTCVTPGTSMSQSTVTPQVCGACTGPRQPGTSIAGTSRAGEAVCGGQPPMPSTAADAFFSVAAAVESLAASVSFSDRMTDRVEAAALSKRASTPR